MPVLSRPGLFGPERPYGVSAIKEPALQGQSALVLLYQNHGLEATWTATSAVPTLPASNLADPIRGKVCRSLGLDTPWRLEADFGTAPPILEGAAIVGSNITPGATVVVKLSDTANWTSPAQQFFITPWDFENTGVLIRLFGGTQIYRYAAIEITDTGNPDGYYEVGVPYLSPIFTLPATAPHEFSWTIVDPSSVSYSTAQTPWTDERSVYAQVDMDWRFIDQTTSFGNLQTVLRAMGRKKDGVLAMYADSPAFSAATRSLNIYGRFHEIPPLVQQRIGEGLVYHWGPVVFREVL